MASPEQGILCQLDYIGRSTKPSSNSEYGEMRDRVIQKNWDFLGERDFLEKVTKRGQAFFGCLFRGRDLMELQSQRECWLTQTLIGVDFDHCSNDPLRICQIYETSGYPVWAGYSTFSDEDTSAERSFRLLWRVEVNLNRSYEETFSFIKELSAIPGKGLADPRSRDPGRLWQGTNKGLFLYDPSSPRLEIPKNHDLPGCPLQ